MTPQEKASFFRQRGEDDKLMPVMIDTGSKMYGERYYRKEPYE